MSTAKVTSKGQVTIPAQVREHLHLEDGERLDFVIREDGRVELLPVKGSVRALFGCLPSPKAALSQEDLDQLLLDTAKAEDERSRT